jgi:hypothetical protein
LGKNRPKRPVRPYWRKRPLVPFFRAASAGRKPTGLQKLLSTKLICERRFEQKTLKTPFTFYASVRYRRLQASLATSGRWSIDRHKRTLAPVGKFAKNSNTPRYEARKAFWAKNGQNAD